MHRLGEIVEPTDERGSPHIGIHRAGIDQNAGIQQVLRVKCRLDLTEDLERRG